MPPVNANPIGSTTPSPTSVTVTYNPPQSQEDAPNTNTNNLGSLIFPKKLLSEFRHIMHFQRYEYSRADAKAKPTATAVGRSMTLPIPEGLQSNYSAKWNQEDLGLVGNQLSKGAGEIAANMKQNGNSIKDSISKYLSDNIGNKAANFAQAAALDAAFSLPGADSVSKALGLTRNPFSAILYEAPEFRTFNFAWKFIPSNMQEATTIKEIIKEFKLGMHASYANFDDNIYKYPDIWVIDTPNPDYLFKFTHTVLTAANINYQGEGTNTFFNTDMSVPLSITVSLNFQEIALLMKEDIQKGF